MRFVTPLSPIVDRTHGEMLKRKMKEGGWTNESLSQATNLSTKTITNLRTAKSQGNFATWTAIARAMGLTVEEVTGA